MSDMPTKIIVATRQSALARYQTNWVIARLSKHYPQCAFEQLPLQTQADLQQDKTLYEMGGKGAFVSTLDHALLDKRADIAVHSVKDVPIKQDNNLCMPAICQRHDPRDVWVCAKSTCWDDLKPNARIGTSSLRRQSQLLAMQPNLSIAAIRGNIATRLEKSEHGDYDGIVLAAAGIERLGLGNRITSYFTPEQILPAAGQGAVGVCCRIQDASIQAMLTCVHHEQTAFCVQAERQVCRLLGGGCHLPIAVYATCQHENMLIRVRVGTPDGKKIITHQCKGGVGKRDELVEQLVDKLISSGAADIISAID